MKYIYFIGIKGVGMTALAVFAKQLGIKVAGSDVEEEFVTDKILLKNGIKCDVGFEHSIAGTPDLVVMTNAHGGMEKNTQARYARKKRIKIVSYGEALGIISQDYDLLAVAGVHGKSTTTAACAYFLEKAGLSPSYIVGCGSVPNLGDSSKVGNSKLMVVEADEYFDKNDKNGKPKFLYLNPKYQIITSIEMDHPDVYGSESDIYNAFYDFACKVNKKGLIIADTDYSKVKRLSMNLVDRNFLTYGFNSQAKYQIMDRKVKNQKNIFSIKHERLIYGPFKTILPGEGNVANLAAAIIFAMEMGVEEETLKKLAPKFKGIERRFEYKGEKEGVLVYDDYAHHPTAIQVTLAGVREFFPENKIWVVFQPHTFSRTRELLPQFAQSFKDADGVIVTDIYPSAREKVNKRISARDLVLAIGKNQEKVYYFGDNNKIVNFLGVTLKPGDILITIGAGDAQHIGEKFLGKKNG